MSNYRRHYVPGGTWFFTVNLQNRQSDLLTRHIDSLRAATLTVKRAKPFTINAWVILPEHMHCIWTLPEGDCDFSARWRDIKKTFSRNIEMRHIWQSRFWEHTIRDEIDLNQHIDYIHYNPVKHGYVESPAQWPHSSIHRFIEKGLLAADWGSNLDTAFGNFGEA